MLGLLGACGSESAQSTTVATPAGSDSPVVTLHSRPDAPSPSCAGLDTPLAPPAPGEAAAKRAMPGLDVGCLGEGAGLNLRQLRGPALVNAWASWCGPCSEEMPFLVATHAAVGDTVRFVGLNISDDAADARAWNAYHGVTWPSLRDADGRSRARLRYPGPPVSFFVRSDGGIAGVHYGAFTSTAQVREALAEYLGIAGEKSSEAPA
jgi:thiol-disulfide isomerase/thioredoxin